MQPQPPQAIFLKDYQPPDFIIETVNLEFDLYDQHTRVRSVLTLQKNPAASGRVVDLVLDGEDLLLELLSIDGQCLDQERYELTPTSLIVHDVADSFQLETHVRIEPQANTSLMGLYRSSGNFCTQCEAHGFRRITYFLDRPDVMTRFSVTITADKKQYPYLLSNGNLLEQRDLADGRHWVHWEDPSLKPCYLFALVAGDFDVLEDSFTTCSGRELALKFYLEKGFGEQGRYALESLQRAMRWDEQNYGREYDLDIYMVVAVSDFNMGAMENKGLNVFNTKYVLAKPETATDSDYVGIEDVIGHEYFHNWTGNRVTCRDWFQLTLKEGLTVFRDQTFSEDMTSEAVARIAEVNVVRNSQFPEDAGPLAHPIRPPSYIEINNFYTATVYRKGAEVIRMIRTLITADKFRQGMDLYFERHDGQAVTTDDFVAAMADASGKDLSQFKRWYDQAGTPVLDITAEYEADSQRYTLFVKQSCPITADGLEKQPFCMPLAVGLLGINGEALALHRDGDAEPKVGTQVLELTESEHRFVFNRITEKPVPSLNRGFSAPVKVNFNYTLEELAHLVQFDCDAVGRWDAAQQLASRVICQAAEAIDNGQLPRMNSVMAGAVAGLLEDKTTDHNLLAQLVVLPSVNYLLLQSSKLDVIALFKAREFYLRELAVLFEANWLEQYQQHHTAYSYTYSVTEMGRRSWKNVCLLYLVWTENNAYARLAVEQLQSTDNMTDSIGALVALNEHRGIDRDEGLQYFYGKWCAEPLVINKWLLLQSCSGLPETLKRVKELEQHSAYDSKNPNNIYALICGFGANLPALHACKEGMGYQFLADKVIEINAYNPQVAARVIAPLTRCMNMTASVAL